MTQQRYLRSNFFGDKAQILITTRCGGDSCAPYDCFNLGLHVGDDPQQVQANREILLRDIGCQHLCFMNQTHSNKVLGVSSQASAVLGIEDQDKPKAHKQKQEQEQESLLSTEKSELIKVTEPIVRGLDCDGLVTAEQGVALAVMTADCLPVLLCDPTAKVIGAIHCGWKGTLYDIAQNAVDKMCLMGAQRAKIRAFIGPGIAQGSFEVGADVREAFLSKHAELEQYFAPEGHFTLEGKLEPTKDKYLCNLQGICRSLLLQAGLAETNIEIGPFDTYQQDELFYSYRRHKNTGRMASVVWLG